MRLNTPTFDLPTCAEPRCRAARRVLWLYLLLTILPWLSIPSLPCEGETLLLFPLLTWPLLILLVAPYRIRTRSGSLWPVVQLPLCFLLPLVSNAWVWNHPHESWAIGAGMGFFNVGLTAEMLVLYPLFRWEEHRLRAKSPSSDAPHAHTRS